MATTTVPLPASSRTVSITPSVSVVFTATMTASTGGTVAADAVGEHVGQLDVAVG